MEGKQSEGVPGVQRKECSQGARVIIWVQVEEDEAQDGPLALEHGSDLAKGPLSSFVVLRFHKCSFSLCELSYLELNN